MPDYPEFGTEELFDQAPCALLVTLPTGEIVRANRTFFEWLGAAPEEVIGTARFQALLTMGSRIYYETHYAPLLQMQGFVSEIALEIRRKDGRVAPVVASARQVKDDDGVPRANHVALFDSSDRRRYERELLEERKRAERASKALEAADTRKNEFIAMLAHELRNPLAPIRNAIELRARRNAQEQLVDKTNEMLQRQVGQMVRLVDDLLDLSRIGQDKLVVKRVPVDLASVVHHAAEASEPLLAYAGVTLQTFLPSSPIYLEADAGRMAQIIGNLLNNAAKFTPRGGVVSLTLEREGPEATIRVRDTGIGIDERQLGRVFDMFMQTDLAVERRSGLGIGLTLTRNLVERHGGQIAVKSEGLGKGTEFTIRLPALNDAPASVGRTAASTPSERRCVPGRVLVVDDNRDSADMLTLLLESHAHDVRQAHDGLKAVEIATEWHPDVVLLDIGLPRLNGYQVAERIRSQSTFQPFLVALTGWGQEEDRRKAEEAGFDAHLLKPVDHDVLIDLIADLRKNRP
jgi:PAS domain S-box-containing protein